MISLEQAIEREKNIIAKCDAMLEKNGILKCEVMRYSTVKNVHEHYLTWFEELVERRKNAKDID